MAKEKKVYLPKWIAWTVTVIMLPVWAWITYAAFTDPKTREELGLVGWLVVSIVILGSIVIVFLMSYGKLPAYIIKEEDEQK